MANELAMSMESPLFEKMRKDLDAMINGILWNMEVKNISAATVNLRISMEIETGSVLVSDRRYGETTRPAIIPDIGYKLTAKMESKSETGGQIVDPGTYELKRDGFRNYYAVTHEEAGGQLSMFEGETDA